MQRTATAQHCSTWRKQTLSPSFFSTGRERVIHCTCMSTLPLLIMRQACYRPSNTYSWMRLTMHNWMLLQHQTVSDNQYLTCDAKRHSATRQLKSDVLALFNTAKEWAMTNTAPSGSFTSSDRSGLNCMCLAHPTTHCIQLLTSGLKREPSFTKQEYLCNSFWYRKNICTYIPKYSAIPCQLK